MSNDQMSEQELEEHKQYAGADYYYCDTCGKPFHKDDPPATVSYEVGGAGLIMSVYANCGRCTTAGESDETGTTN